MAAAPPARSTNRLAREQSPYLRQHASNPVDWFPWGPEAFARARAEQKPIFLSIGYSTCHWCHVMAHESFEDAVIAEKLNRDFIPVKVDREERPDVDRVYMTYVQAATGQGGWPLSVWLTPERKPFYGGTYFPPADRWGRPGFATLLGVLAQAWAREREKLVAEGERVAGALQQYAVGKNPNTPGPDLADTREPETLASKLAPAGMSEAFDRCLQQLHESFDPTHGGFGGAPKFPRAAVFNFLFRVAAGAGADGGDRKPDGGGTSDRSPAGHRRCDPASTALKMAALTLRRMAGGGLHDHVGGGFHRYAVDAEWFVPHFEKMLYDQAQLAVSYLEARQATGDEHYAWVARDILDYVLRDLARPGGGFYSAEDADSAPPEGGQREPGSAAHPRRQAEGAFYVWTKEEIGRALGPDAEWFCVHYGVVDGGNVPEARDPHGEFRGKNILRQSPGETAGRPGPDPAASGDRLRACLTRLRAVRARRPRPHRDDKILTAWNGLMISALAKGWQVLDERDFLARAVDAAEFLRRELSDGQTGMLYRCYRESRGDIPGFAEDYAYLVQGLIDLYEASFDIRWLQWAEQLQARMDALFWDADAGGYFNSRADDPTLIARLKEDYDGAEPAPGSVAANNLLRLAWMLGEGDPHSHQPPLSEPWPAGELGYRSRALRCIGALRGQWERAPHALPQLLCALELARQPPRTVVLAGDPRAEGFRALTAVLHERLGTRRALLAADGGEGQRWLSSRQPYLGGMKPLAGRATAYVCEDFACRQPVTEPAELRRLLET
ncbi:MAG: thioredoxin domain-containing protein [Opitutaceae bacterium]|nr:thioredoxin domain-containing protein [Opitutaceae bacterium]